MKAVFVASVGVVGPGLENWAQAQATLTGADTYRGGAVAQPRPGLLPANERRRASVLTRTCLVVAQEAISSIAATHAITTDQTPTVFASCHGDAVVTDRICRALATTLRPVSPTDFHNSVHNAPAGYWSIATHSQTSATSVSLQDGTFAAGLLEALTISMAESVSVLLVACDMPLPPPLAAIEQVAGPFAVAMLVTPRRFIEDQPSISASLCSKCAEDSLDDRQLEALRVGNPAARSLPLLRALCASNDCVKDTVCLPYLRDIRIKVEIGR
jgi:hypothetical protein